ncbi:transposase InsO family protein [Variovorax sp. 3319]|nr:transposase InsO family protein [Variovorax sp. 3319]
MSVSLVARQKGVAASLLFQWRKLERQGALTAVSASEAVVPASELAAARAEIAKLQRVMAAHALLLPKAPRRRQSSRPHEGKVAVAHSDMRWCSDGFEIKCDSGQTVTATFTKDCCDREILAYRAWEGKGLPGEPVREMLIEAVEKRFGGVEGVPSTHALEFLSDNGGAYIAAETRQIARQLGLSPVNTPVCSPQSNGSSKRGRCFHSPPQADGVLDSFMPSPAGGSFKLSKQGKLLRYLACSSCGNWCWLGHLC